MGILRERGSVMRQRVQDKFGHGESSFVYIRGFKQRMATRWWRVKYEGQGIHVRRRLVFSGAFCVYEGSAKVPPYFKR